MRLIKTRKAMMTVSRTLPFLSLALKFRLSLMGIRSHYWMQLLLPSEIKDPMCLMQQIRYEGKLRRTSAFNRMIPLQISQKKIGTEVMWSGIYCPCLNVLAGDDESPPSSVAITVEPLRNTLLNDVKSSPSFLVSGI